MSRVALLAVGLVAMGAVVGVSAAADRPLADAGLDQTVTVDTTVQLDGTGSTHPGGTISTYEWTIQTPGGREIQPDCADCERPAFTPSTPGRYEVSLTVTDEAGTEASDTLYVEVIDAGPAVELDGDTTPELGEPVEFEAAAESRGPELEEIAWAIDGEIIAVQSLEGHADESDLVASFDDAETYRLQVAVQGAEGRTTYDELYVQPQTESSGGSSGSLPTFGPSEPDEPEAPEPAPEPVSTPVSPPAPDEPTDPDPPESWDVHYETDGFQSNTAAGADTTDSSYMNMQVEETGIDGGENAPWQQGLTDQIREAGESVSTTLFGQEEETISCETTGGGVDSCGTTVRELERDGGTTNVHSPDDSGYFSTYGLEGAERTSGPDPREADEEDTIKVTITVQEQKDGLIDRAVDTASSVASRDDSSENTKESGSNGGGSGSSSSSSVSTGGSTQSTSTAGLSGSENRAFSTVSSSTTGGSSTNSSPDYSDGSVTDPGVTTNFSTSPEGNSRISNHDRGVTKV